MKNASAHPAAQELAELKSSIKELNTIVQDELEEKLFLFVPANRAEYWDESPLFDEKVQKRLPKAIDDMVEAGKCLAVARYTACVFHLMRVVEIGAKKLGKKLVPSLTHKATLGDITRAIAPVIVAMPTHTAKESERKEAFSKTADHLNHIKDGWRNKTMHPGLSYNEDETFRMFNNVREFMRLLVTLR